MPKKSFYNRHKGKFKTAYNVAQKALTTALKVKSLLNVEFKTIDIAPTTISPPVSGLVVPLNTCAQGNGEGDRDGLSILLKSIYLRYTATSHSSATYTHLRLMLIKDQQPDGTTPAITDILETADPVSLMNNLNTRRFQILWTKTHDLSSVHAMIESDNKYVKVNFHTKYKSTIGGTSSLAYNGVYLVAISNQTTNNPIFRYTTRVRYLDN